MQHRSEFRPLSILVGCAFFMEQLDATIISPAIPDIARSLATDPLGLNITMTVYLLCSLAFIPLGAPLAARWGTRSVFQGAITLFALGSLLCAVSPGLVSLVLSRAIQGVGAALMVPIGRTAIVHSVRKSELVQALAWMITPAMLGPMLGPPLGGLITTYASWEWIFLINVPIALLGLLASRRVMPQLLDQCDAPFQPREWLLMSAVLTLAVLLLEQARHGPGAAPALALGLPLAWLAGWYALRFRFAVRPMVDFRLLSVGTLATGFWGGALVRVGYGALPFILPLMLQIGLGFTALESGLVLLASGAVAFLAKTGTARLLRRWGFRRVLLWNGLLCAAALGGCALAGVHGWSVAGVALVASLAGLFRSIQFNALTAISYADLPPQKVALATTLNTMGWQLAIMFGISLSALAVEWSARMAGHGAPVASDFSMAFVVLALFAFAAVPCYRALPGQAGEQLSGCKPQ